MSQAPALIQRLEGLQEGERSRLRRLTGQPLDKTLQGFDLFTGLWWPLRQQSPIAPRRETSWLIVKLYGAFSSAVPYFVPTGEKHGPLLAAVLGVCEPYDPPDCRAQKRFRARFDALLCSPLPTLEPHLRWAMGAVARAIAGRVPHAKSVQGIDWEFLLDDLSIWDRGEQHRLHRDIRDIWAEAYLNAAERRSPGLGPTAPASTQEQDSQPSGA